MVISVSISNLLMIFCSSLYFCALISVITNDCLEKLVVLRIWNEAIQYDLKSIVAWFHAISPHNCTMWMRFALFWYLYSIMSNTTFLLVEINMSKIMLYWLINTSVYWLNYGFLMLSYGILLLRICFYLVAQYWYLVVTFSNKILRWIWYMHHKHTFQKNSHCLERSFT
jgi:hypothetical protein